jgi:hypothetical protein
MIEKLARGAWGPLDQAQRPLALRPHLKYSAGGYADLVGVLLNHVRSIAQKWSVPELTPRVVVAPVVKGAGLFEEKDGWVTLTVSDTFFLNHPAACSILCHEVCHYVLGANGIRGSDPLANERLTDVAMFVLGLGDVFLAGYRAGSSFQNYAPGHRLGYLSDAEYRYVDDRVFELWASGALQVSNEAALETRLAGRVHDPAVRQRFVEAELRKHPHWSRVEALQHVIDQYERDRR